MEVFSVVPLLVLLWQQTVERHDVGYGGIDFASACRGRLEEPYVVLSNRKDSVTKWRNKWPRCGLLCFVRGKFKFAKLPMTEKLVGHNHGNHSDRSDFGLRWRVQLLPYRDDWFETFCGIR